VFQSFNLIPFKTAAENVALPLYYQGVGRRKRLRQAKDYMEKVGLLDWASTGRPRCRAASSSAWPSRARSWEGRRSCSRRADGRLDSETSVEIMKILQQVNAEGMTVVWSRTSTDIAA
jgi:putative ABC transport system ATP-binding protein